MKPYFYKTLVTYIFRGIFLLTAVFLTSHPVGAANLQWTGATDQFWATSGNWTPAGPPTIADTAFFFDAGGAASAGIVDNIVAASTTIAALKYSNTNNFHTTQINSGQTLTVTNGLTVGTETGTVNNDQIVTATVTGPGTLSVSGGNIIVRQCNGSSSSIRNATLDMSGLSNFTATVSSLQIGVQISTTSPFIRASGAVILAMTNQIKATNIVLNFNPTSPVLGNNNLLYFGQTNSIYVNIITNGGDKGQFSTLMAFRPGLNNPVAYIRAADGVSRVATWMTGDNSHQTSSANTANGTEDFSGGTVDALVGTMALGKSASTTGGAGTGALIVGNGTVDVNTLQVGYQTANNATSVGKGSVTVGAMPGTSQGTVKVNTLMEVGKATGGTGAGNSFGVVTVTNGGTLQAKSIVFGATGQADLFTIDGGKLVVNDTAATVVGSSTVPLATLNVTNSSLRLSLNGSTATTPKIYVSTLDIPTTGGPTTSINIDSVANISTTTTFSIINFTTLNGDPTTFVVGNLPAGYSATVTSTGSQIQLQVTPPAFLITSATATPSALTISQNTLLSVSVTGGTPPYTVVVTNTTAGSPSPVTLVDNGSGTTFTNSITIGGSTALGSYSLPVLVTDSASGSTTANISLTVQNVTLTWNGAGSDNNWTTANNWSGVNITGGDSLAFDGTTRLANNNNTTAGTTYSNLTFNASAGAFVLSGNPITLPAGGGGIVNNSSTSVETVDLGVNFSANQTLNGGANGLILGGGLTNNATGTTIVTTTLSGGGTLTNLFGIGASATGTNLLSTAAGANWTIMDNPGSSAITAPWSLDVYNGGTLNFGSAGSAPNVTFTAVDGVTSLRAAIGNATGASTMNMVNGTLTLNTRLNVGNGNNASVSTLNVTGGTLQARGAGISIADNSVNTVSAVNVSGGILESADSAGTAFNTLYVATRGTGTLNISGSGLVECSQLEVCRNIGTPHGTVNLNGGTLLASFVTASDVTNGGTAAFNFNGGTLKAGAASVNFSAGTANVPLVVTDESGGAVIDTAGNTLTIAAVINHDSTLGGTPDGGLTKLGSGTLILTAADTYTGNTTIKAGTLTLTGAGSINSSANIAVNDAIFDGSASSSQISSLGNLSLTNGTFNLGTNPVASLNNLAISNSTLTFPVIAGTPNINVTGLATGGTTNLINVTSVPGLPVYPTNLTLIKYSTVDSSVTNANNLLTTLGVKLPALGSPVGYLTNNVGNASIDLVLISGPAPVNTDPATVNFQAVAGSGSMRFTWAQDHLGWQLYTNGVGLTATGSWFPVAGSSSVTNLTIPINPALTNVFFQLRYP
jgi:autotransporter-associated beta strand protein